jgi:hypothetical protein
MFDGLIGALITIGVIIGLAIAGMIWVVASYGPTVTIGWS